MLVSHLHKFIYIKTSKAAGTSIESYFEKFCMPPGEWERMQYQDEYRDEYVSDTGMIWSRGKTLRFGFGDDRPINYTGWNNWNRMPAVEVKKRLSTERWDEYFKFCAMRNPWDQVISKFYWEKHNSNKPVLDLASERREFEDWCVAQILIKGTNHTVSDMYTIDDKFCLDDVIRYETLSSDMARICAKIGVPWQPERLPKFKSGIRPADASISNLHTDTTVKLVADLFAFEIETFKYILHNT